MNRLIWRSSLHPGKKTEETQNTKDVGDFPTFPKSGKTPDFDTGQRSSR
jgi:hypothetical protein